MDNFRFFKLTEISTDRSAIPFSKSRAVIEDDNYTYAIYGNDVFIVIDGDKRTTMTIDLVLIDLIKGFVNYDKEND